ncbi:MAG: transglutaminase-like domain-containing protein [Planctomycetota bacterium]|jgi:transglutaminase-like putative cysteine protease
MHQAIRSGLLSTLVVLVASTTSPVRGQEDDAEPEREPPSLLEILESTESIIWKFHVEVINRNCILHPYGGDCATPFTRFPITHANVNLTGGSTQPAQLISPRFTAFNERLDTIPTHGNYFLDSARVYFPLLRDTPQAEWDHDRIESKLTMQPVYSSIGKLESRYEADTQPDIQLDERIGYQYGVWEATSHATEAFILTMDIPVRTHSLEFDEQRAMSIPWPTEWPAQVQHALQPQTFVSDDPIFDAMVAEWIGDPARHNPTWIAKRLLGQLVNNYTTSGLPVDWNTPLPGSIRGIRPMYAANSAEQMVGTSLDMAGVLVGLLRAAGIPARVVIGYDIGASPDGLDLPSRDNFEDCALVNMDSAPQLPLVRGWVEFYLYDEAANQGVWIPVDPFRQQRDSSRVPPIEQPWKFFGNYTCGAIRIPIAHHVVSPYTDVASVWPASFLSWDAQPTPIGSTQYTILSAMEMPRRAGEPVWPKDQP